VSKGAWTTAPLGAVVDILDSRRVPVNAKEREHRRGQVPYYGATGQVGWIDDAIFDEELVLLGEDGAPFFDRTRDVAYLIRGPAWVNNHAHVLRGGPRISNRFLFHQLNQVDYRPFVSGTTRAKLPQGPMREIPLVLPPREEQDRIVAAIETHFSRLDAAVASLTRAKANVKRARASILKAAVEGRLVPTEAELARAEGREYEPANAIHRIVDGSSIAPRKPGRKAAARGPAPTLLVPEGWETVLVSDVAAEPLCNGRSVPTRDDGFRVLRLSAMKAGRIDFAESKGGDWTVDDARPWLVETGDFLIMRGNGSIKRVGSGAIAGDPTSPVAFPDTIIRLRPRPDVLSSRYLLVAWSSHVLRSQIEASARTTAGIYKINQSSIANYYLPLPPLAEQHRIVAEVDRRFSVLDAIEATIDANLARCARLRQSILKQAFEGRLVPTDDASADLGSTAPTWGDEPPREARADASADPPPPAKRGRRRKAPSAPAVEPAGAVLDQLDLLFERAGAEE
jgi:type I restriction enzyme S subunit